MAASVCGVDTLSRHFGQSARSRWSTRQRDDGSGQSSPRARSGDSRLAEGALPSCSTARHRGLRLGRPTERRRGLATRSDTLVTTSTLCVDASTPSRPAPPVPVARCRSDSVQRREDAHLLPQLATPSAAQRAAASGSTQGCVAARAPSQLALPVPAARGGFGLGAASRWDAPTPPQPAPPSVVARRGLQQAVQRRARCRSGCYRTGGSLQI